MDIKLIVQTGEHNGQIIPIDVHEYYIGRDPDCHYYIDNSLIDPRHCRIHLFGGRVSLTDLKTVHGTVVNDQYISSLELRDGDRVKVGPITFLVSIEAAPKDLDRRVQDWCVSTLDTRNAQAVGTGMKDAPVDEATAEMARKILGKLSHREGVTEGRKRLRVGESRGITVVKFIDNSIVQDTDVNDVDREMTELVATGVRRIVLNFFNVENLSSQIVGTLMKVNSQCVDHGGQLKVCNLKPKVVSVFTMTGLDKLMKIVRDEKIALEGEWPGIAAQAAPIPAGLFWDPEEEEAFSAPLNSAFIQPAPASTAPSPPAARDSAVLPRGVPTSSRSSLAAVPGPSRVGLLVSSGKAEGKVVDIPGNRFFIGSDPSCQLRPKSPVVGVMHAVIERRDGQVFVRDLGSGAGTILNDRMFRSAESVARDGDRLQIGPLQFTFSIGSNRPPDAPKPEPVDDLSSSWLFQGAIPGPMDDLAANGSARPPALPLTALETTLKSLGRFAEPETTEDPPRPRARPSAVVLPPEVMHLAYEVIQDVLLLKILTPDLNDETTVAPLRAEVQALFDHPHMPRRVVLNLESVTYLSSRAVGLILAHYQRLERSGGKLRLCHVRPKVMPTLEQMRLPMLIDIYPTVDEALLTSWSGEGGN